ncbi:uncharacterized protein LOC144524023 [Sander vitreus]
MSVFIQTRGEAGGGVAAHLECPVCGHFSTSHAHQLTHMAASHPACLDAVTVGRLGNIVTYQSTARLFHCSNCFHTCRDFTKLYTHIISKHCVDDREEEEEEEKDAPRGTQSGEKEAGKDKLKRKQREEEEEEEGGGKEAPERKQREEEERGKDKLKRKQREEEEGGKDKLKRKQSEEEEEEEGGGKEAPERKQREEEERGKDKLKRKRKEEEEGGKDAPERKRRSEEEEEEVRADGEEGGGVLMASNAGFRCLICGWKTKLKSLVVIHVSRKHDIPKKLASQAVGATATSGVCLGAVAAAPTAGDEDVVVDGLSGEMLKEEMEATAKVVRFTHNRFVCLICGWKTKLKGFAISHVVRCHDVERPYRCRACPCSFFLPSRLQQHVRTDHRPGRYACPFCCFRSHFLGGFRRHCSRCNAREEGEGEGEGGGAAEAEGAAAGEEEENEEEEEEEKKDRKGRRRRRRVRIMMEEEEEED